MKKVKLGTILENAARLAGRQVSLVGVPDGWRALASLAVSDGIRRIAAEKFPMMQRVEYRRYRPAWISNDGWTRNQECWHVDRYYRLEAEVSTAAPDAGGGWRRLKGEEVVAFIAWDQPWESTSIDRSSVDVNRFAYLEDPRQNPTATPLKVVGMNELGAILQVPAASGVYVRFVPRFPNVSYIEWNGKAAYEAGECAYLTSTRECYQCISSVLAPASGATDNLSPVDDHEHWEPVRISADFENYLTRLAAADLLTEDQGKYQTRAAADKEFEEICARYHEGNGECRVRTGRFMR